METQGLRCQEAPPDLEEALAEANVVLFPQLPCSKHQEAQVQLQLPQALLDPMGAGAEYEAHEDTAAATLMPLLLPPAGQPVADAAYAPSALVDDTRGPVLAAMAV